MYEPFSGGRRHGNFLDASYQALIDRPEWKRRLEKVHTHAVRSLPGRERVWRELDSCMSSDALLMNVFCHPQTLASRSVRSLLGVEESSAPDFGFKARVPLLTGRTDRTEVDMRLGTLLVEAKLTETDFQVATAVIVECYRDLDCIFAGKALPTVSSCYASYQLIRNVLAAHTLEVDFCVLLDARRPDLREAWYTNMSCVRNSTLKTRCKVLTWQELAEVLPASLRYFLDIKYGIVPPGQTPSEFGERDY